MLSAEMGLCKAPEVSRMAQGALGTQHRGTQDGICKQHPHPPPNPGSTDCVPIRLSAPEKDKKQNKPTEKEQKGTTKGSVMTKRGAGGWGSSLVLTEQIWAV